MNRSRYTLTVFALLALLGAVGVISLMVGAERVPVAEVWRTLRVPDESLARTIVYGLRLPRTLVAMLVGANLGVAGAIMQGMTRNPLAGPNILGVNSGAALTMAALTALAPGFPLPLLPFAAFAGAAAAGIMVYGLAGSGGITPVRLALAGVATAAMMGALTTGLLVIREQHATVYLWLAGSLFARTWPHLQLIAPWALVGLLMAGLSAPQVNVLLLGEDVARGLGVSVERIRLLLGLLVVILAGSAVATAGPIGFVGLMVPHISRKIVGTDYRRLLPVTAVMGATLLLGADVVARVIIAPREAPVGAVTAALGAPFFLYLARREG
ncbi:MAG: FecCD family ABC transporter permease [Bacillota bacterium]